MKLIKIHIILALILMASSFSLSAPSIAHESIGELEEKMRSWLLKNPEILLKMSAVLDIRRQEQQSKADIDLVNDAFEALYSRRLDEHESTDEGGQKILLAEFIDYNCGYCKRQSQILSDFISQQDNVELVIKEFPILGPGSQQAARAALAVKEIYGQNAYIRFHKALLASRGQLDQAIIDANLEQLGFNPGEVLKIASGDNIDKQIAETLALGTQLGIQGTPAFVFSNGQIARGFLQAGQLAALTSITSPK